MALSCLTGMVPYCMGGYRRQTLPFCLALFFLLLWLLGASSHRQGWLLQRLRSRPFCCHVSRRLGVVQAYLRSCPSSRPLAGVCVLGSPHQRPREAPPPRMVSREPLEQTSQQQGEGPPVPGPSCGPLAPRVTPPLPGQHSLRRDGPRERPNGRPTGASSQPEAEKPSGQRSRWGTGGVPQIHREFSGVPGPWPCGAWDGVCRSTPPFRRPAWRCPFSKPDAVHPGRLCPPARNRHPIPCCESWRGRVQGGACARSRRTSTCHI
eukprot:jgi/Botrbrau1/20107/Bobra.0173s0010.1